MSTRLLNLALVVTSLMGYLEWGANQSTWLFKAETELIVLALDDPSHVIHPFTVLPMLGQVLLLATLFQRRVSRGLTYVGIACIGLLLALMFAIGVMALNLRILGSTLPFLTLAMLTIRRHRADRRAA